MRFAALLYKQFTWRAINLVSLFLVNILISRVLGAADSGGLFYLVTVYAFIILLLSFCFESGLSFYFARQKINSKEALMLALGWVSIATLVGFVPLLFMTSEKTVLSGNRFFVFSLMYISGNLLIGFFNQLFNIKYDYKVPNLVLSIINIALVLVLTAGYLLIKNSGQLALRFTEIYLSSFFLAGVTLCAIFIFRYLNVRERVQFSNEKLKPLFKYAFQAFSTNFIFFLMVRIDYFFVERYCSANELGNYIQVSKIAGIIFLLPGMISGVVFPVTANDSHSLIEEKLTQIARYQNALIILVCLVLVATGFYLFPLIYGNSFNEMYSLFILSVPGIILLSLCIPIAAYFAGRNKIRINTIANILALIVIFTCDLIFVPKYGSQAAALIMSLGYSICAVFILYFFLKETKTSILNLFIIKKQDVAFLKGLMKNSRNKGDK